MASADKIKVQQKHTKKREPLPPLFGKQSILIMLAGLVVIAIGMILMSGGNNPDPNVFNNEEVYGFRRITLAPIIILVGFGIELIAIFWKEKKKDWSGAVPGWLNWWSV